MRFFSHYTSRQHQYSLGQDQETSAYYLSIPVANRLVTYEEYYKLEDDQYTEFKSQPELAKAFAEECRKQQHDGLLILKPGADRGMAI